MADGGTWHRAPMPLGEDPHTVLGVQPGSSVKEIRAAFRRKALLLHPDKASLRSSVQAPPTCLTSPGRGGSAADKSPDDTSQACPSSGDDDTRARTEPIPASLGPITASCASLRRANRDECFIRLTEAYKALLPRQAPLGADPLGELWANRNAAVPIKRSQLVSFDGLLDEPGVDDDSGLDEMLFFTCRCGDDLIVEKEEVELGLDFLDCSGCSMIYRLVE